MATKNYAANLKIGAVMSSTVGRVFGGLKAKIKEHENSLKSLRAAYKQAEKGSGEWAGKLDQLKAKIAATEKELLRLRATSGKIGALGATMASDFKRFGTGVKWMAGGVTALGIAAAGSATALYSLTKGFVDWADDIGDLAESLNMSTQALQTWQFAAATVGVNSGQLNASFGKFNKTVAEGGKKTDAILSQLGINAARLRKLKLDEQLDVTAEAFARYKGTGNKAAMATALFGRSGYKLAGILSKGKKGLDEFRKVGIETGAVLDEDAAEAAGNAAAAFDTLGMTITGLRNTVAIQFVPVISRMVGELSTFIRSNGPQIKQWAQDFGKTLETKVVPALVTMWQKLPSVLSQIGDMAGKFWDGIKAVKEFVGGWDKLAIALVAVNFAPTALAISNILIPALYNLGKAAYAASGPWGALIGLIASIPLLVGDGDYMKGLETIGGAIKVNAVAIANFVKQVWQDTAQWFGRNYEALLVTIDEIKTKIVKVFDEIAQAIKDAFTRAFDWIGAKIDAFTSKTMELGRKIKEFFTWGGGGQTSMIAPSNLAPAESMPGSDRGIAQTNNVHINVNAPGQDGTGIARQVRQELARRPLFDMDGALVPA